MRNAWWMRMGLISGGIGLAGALGAGAYAQAVMREQARVSELRAVESAARMIALALGGEEAIGNGNAPAGGWNSSRVIALLETALDSGNAAHSMASRAFVVKSGEKLSVALATVSGGKRPNPDDPPPEPPAGDDPLAQLELPATAKRDEITVIGRGSLFDEQMYVLCPVLNDAGKPVVFAGMEVDERRLGSVVQEPKLRVMYVSLAVGAATAAASMLVAFMLTRRVRNAAEAMNKLAAGDVSVHIEDEGSDECAALARGINHAADVARRHEELRRSMKLGEQVQRALLPAAAPKIPGLEIAHFCVYCDQVGGDYIDYIPIAPGEQGDAPADTWAIVVGDGTGHGVPAALLMATARAVLRTHPLRQDSLAQCVGQINTRLCRQVPEGRFLTLFALLVGPHGRSVRWLSAGHDEAIVFDPQSQTFSEMKGSDIPLGVDEHWEFTDVLGKGPLPRGGVVVIGTDGIWEMRNAGDVMFGKDQLKRIIRRWFNEPAHVIGEQLLAALKHHRGDVAQQDDVTFIVLKVVG